MKPSAFEYERPASIAEACALLSREDLFAKVLAGGQSLGPMLNLRLVQPDLLVDVTRIDELRQVEETDSAVVLGACVTHAAIEDGCLPGHTGKVLQSVARGIAYRAVRTRGTIGGSLAHADPSADWISCLAALGAEAIVAGAGQDRRVKVAEFMQGVFETTLWPNELLRAISIPRISKSARWGYYKVCRKTGEFAHAIGAVLCDPDGDILRAVVGATEAPPIVIDDAWELLSGPKSFDPANFDAGAARSHVRSRGLDADPFALQIHIAALRRAFHQAATP